ncbi:Sulfite exporter TauE/SafE [Aquisphaera giovannonii]|uniref:Probable membrane transporter protein n=1 Tax=Aquisphaera giovannonii TaxID=406548 RepID=A0A5B9WBJ6_9BACT|nr:sulfite exporter TauE/SafE family protein [Aquisphaera giovannonii]QEH37644.1 Sulfite exporter TauE/SafE [Aquisphaera giovannonii]
MSVVEILMVVLLGLAAGFLSGMFGIGGGLVIVPLLIVFYNFEPKTAVGTSLFALLLPTGLLAVLEYYRRGEMRPLAGLFIAAGLFCGAYFGARITGAISVSTMKRSYGVFLIVVAIYFFWSSSPERNPMTARRPRASGDAPALDLSNGSPPSEAPAPPRG